MRFRSILKFAVRSLNRNKMRSFLTMLGVIIGVAAVIAMLAIGQGARNAINRQIAALGSNVILITPGAFSQRGVHAEAGTTSHLNESDIAAMKKRCGSIGFCSPMVRAGEQIKFADQNWRTSVWGVYEEYLDIRDWTLAEGLPFSDADEHGATKVCIIGKTIVDNLFQNGENPIGQSIRIRNLPFKVIGVLAQKGQNAVGQDQDDVILAPFSTVQKKILGIAFAQSPRRPPQRPSRRDGRRLTRCSPTSAPGQRATAPILPSGRRPTSGMPPSRRQKQ